MTVKTATSPNPTSPLLLDEFRSIKQAPISTKKCFEEVQNAMRSPHAVSDTLAAIDQAEKNLFAKIASSNESLNRYNNPALLVPSICIPEKEASRLYQALDLDSSLTIESKRLSALKQAISFTRSENDEINKNALNALKQARIALSFFKKTHREHATSFTWKYVRSCLENLHPPHIKYNKKPLGKGTEATVLEVEINSNPYAAKLFPNSHVNEDGLTKSEAEAAITIDLHHYNIMKPLMVTSSYIFYEKATTSLHSLLKSNTLSSVEITRIFRTIAEAMTYLHSMDILHRDLKDHNILLVKNALGLWIPKLTDFSFACYATNHTKLKRPQGTPSNLSQELAEALRTGTLLADYKKADVYSLGVMIFRLLSTYDSPIVDDAHPTGAFKRSDDFLKRRAEYPYALTKEHLEPLLDPQKRRLYDEKGVLFALMCDCLQDDFERRPDMADIVQRLTPN